MADGPPPAVAPAARLTRRGGRDDTGRTMSRPPGPPSPPAAGGSPPPATLARAYGLLWDVSRGRRLAILAAAGLSLAMSTLTVLGPALTAEFFKVFQTPAGQSVDLSRPIPVQFGGSELFRAAPALVLGLAAAATLAAALVGLLGAWLEEHNRQALTLRVKQSLYRRAHACHFLDPARPAGELMSLISGQSQNVVGLLPTLVFQPLNFGWQMAFAVGLMASASPWLTAVYLGILLLVNAVLPRVLGLDRRVNQASADLRDAVVDEANVLNEQLAARDMVDALGAARVAEERAAARFVNLARAQLRLVLLAQVRGLCTPLAAISFPVLVFLGAWQGVALSSIVLLWGLQPAVFAAAQGLASLVPAWLRLSPSVGMVLAELGRRVPPTAQEALFTAAPAISLRGVTAVLPDGKKILDGIDADFAAGRLTAVVGRGGTGKSLLLDVIAGRFRGSVSGTVAFDGAAVPAERLADYRAQIPRLNQSPQLLRMRVDEFICFGAPRPPVRGVEEAIDLAGLGPSAPAGRRMAADDVIFVTRRPSGTQQQALRLAQWMVRPLPPVMLFDEPDSAMSPEDAAFVQRRIIDLTTPAATVVMVTHAPQLLPPDTTVVFLKDGRVEAVGTHQRLVSTSESYRQLVHELSSGASRQMREDGAGTAAVRGGSSPAMPGGNHG